MKEKSVSKQFWTMAVAVGFLGLVFGLTGCGGAALLGHGESLLSGGWCW